MAANDESGDGNDVHINHDYTSNADISGEYTANENGHSDAGTVGDDDNKQKIDRFVDQDDLDLQNAIGDVFGQFDFGQLGEEVKDEISGPVQQGKDEHEHEDEHRHDDSQDEQLQLEHGHIRDGEIKDYSASRQQEVQDGPSGGLEEHRSIVQVQEQDTEAHDKHPDEPPEQEGTAGSEDVEGNHTNSVDDDFDLSAAIGDAFAMVSGEQDSGEVKEEVKERGSTDDVTASHHHSDQSDGELDLEAVIGNAFESLTGNGEQSNPEEGDTNKEHVEITKPAASQEEELHSAPNKEPSSHHITAPIPVVVNSSGSFLHEDLDLESAIGDAFKEINEKSHEDPTVHDLDQENDHRGEDNHDLGHSNFNEHNHEHSHDHEEDLDLENAIGNAFKSLSEQQPEENHSQTVTSQNEPPRPKQSNSSLPISDNGKTEEEKDLDIESAISEAFKSAIKPYDPSAGRLTSNEQPQSLLQQHTEPQSQSLAGDLSFVVQNLVSQISNNNEAISTSNASQNNSIPEDILQELALEITNQVQDHGNQNKKKQPQLLTDMPQIDDNVLAHFQNEAYKDEQGKDDTGNTSGKIDSNSLQAALATVVRNAIESNSTTLGDNNARQRSILGVDPTRRRDSITSNVNDGTVGGGADLDQLRMNDILQNAFNMAMENPQDLLSNLDMDEENLANASSTGVAASNSAVAAALAKLSHPIPSSTTTFLESLNRSQDIELGGSNKRTERIAAVAKNLMNAISDNGTGNGSGERKKSLSIAETLALHRSSMTGGPRRDYSSIESIEEVLRSEQQRTGSVSATAGYPNNPYMSLVNNSQLSNALSSLSSHINSGSTGGETNLLNVIRQMTNSLSSNKLQGYTFLGSTIGSGAHTSANVPTAEEIVASYKDKSESLSVMTQSLQLAKNFLESSQSIDSDNQAISVIDNVLGLFNTKTSTNQFEPIVTRMEAVDLADLKPDAISSIRDSVISSVSNFTNSKHWRMSSLLGEKPKSDTPEYKERIRMENRERKKRWREENAERNKDNDLRSRVLKRASAMFGDLDSFEKKSWVDDEFNKRREKRIAKQKKEDQERRSKNEYFGDPGVENGSSNGSTGVGSAASGEGNKSEDDNPLIHDSILVKNVTDTFNILSGSTSKVEPSAALAATSVATATIAALYAKTHGILDLQQVSSAVCSILSSLMDNTGQKERLLSLSRGISSNFKSTRASNNSFEKSSGITSPSATTPGEGLLNKISSTIRNFASPSSNASDGSNILDLENMKISTTKRKSVDYLGSDPKRLARSVSIGDSRKSVFEQASQLLNANPMKMPQYKKPITLQEQESENSSGQSALSNSSAQSVSSALTNSTTSINTDMYEKTTPTLTAPAVSPFISNKVASSASQVKPPTLGLRKPGSFQRPAFSKPEPRKSGTGIGFPSLYSASFKSK
ncbi:hypothetical protein CLIB1423_12S01552 [[Candida] railenensis]|uniref:DUF3020 domain-containing protein n=1 Tax=[Candida] railenensis TaxID=45579 RepID=A0A9P0VZL8_9ASCO|nr:hypothetical protein CLIB1423_12S01552 [[Candida] railenensis]